MFITSVIWLCGFLRMSTTGLSAQALGRNHTNENLLVLFRGLVVALGVGGALILLQSPYINIALNLSGGSDEVQFYARQYSEIRVWGFPAALSNLVILGWLLGNHQTKAVMWTLIITNLVNVCLDLLFVFVFDWQVQGVALATLIAEYSGAILGLTVIFSRYKSRLKTLTTNAIEFLHKLLAKDILLNYFKLNRDILIRTLCLEICFIFITFQGAKLGDDVVAANAILMNFLLLISFGLDGIANATEAIVGKAQGEKNTKKLKATIKIASFWTALFALFYMFLFAVAGEFLLSIISDIPSVLKVAKEHLVWMIWLPIIACWCFLYDGVYIGLMQAKAMRNSMIIATFGGFFPLWYLLQDFGNHGLWAAFLLFMLVRGATLAWHLNYKLLGENLAK